MFHPSDSLGLLSLPMLSLPLTKEVVKSEKLIPAVFQNMVCGQTRSAACVQKCTICWCPLLNLWGGKKGGKGSSSFSTWSVRTHLPLWFPVLSSCKALSVASVRNSFSKYTWAKVILHPLPCYIKNIIPLFVHREVPSVALQKLILFEKRTFKNIYCKNRTILQRQQSSGILYLFHLLCMVVQCVLLDSSRETQLSKLQHWNVLVLCYSETRRSHDDGCNFSHCFSM